MDFSAKATPERGRLLLAPPVLYATAPLLDSTPQAANRSFSRSPNGCGTFTFEAIPETTDRNEVRGMLRVRFQLVAQLHYERINHPLDNVRIVPHPVENLCACQYLALRFDETPQKLEFGS